MTAGLEPQTGITSAVGVQLGIITEDATVISITNYETAPAAAANGKIGMRKSSEEDSEDAPSKPANIPVARPLDPDEISTADEHKPVAIPVKRGRRFSFKVPSYVWYSLALLIVFEALAVTGAILYARSVNHDARRATADIARSSARAIETLLDHLIAPVMSLAHLVHLQPHWPTINASFGVFSDAIYQTNPYYQIELCPYGIVGAMAMPWMNATGDVTADDWAGILKTFDSGLDVLDPNRSTYTFELSTILQNNSVILAGPWYADGELSSGAFVLRYSIFLQPGNWDMPSPNSIQYCPRDVCYTPDGLAWWGWSNAVFAWKTVAPGLRFIESRNLLYTLSPDPHAKNQSYLANSEKLPNPHNCEIVRVDVYGWMHWTFCVEPDGGFGPTWRVGLILGVTALSVVLAGLVGLMLRSRHQAVQYLNRQLEANRQLAIAKEEAEDGRRTLEAEKRVMDALLQRQRNLIELFGKEDELLNAVVDGDEAAVQRRLQLAAGGLQAATLSRESATVDRIEAVRRQLTGQHSVKQSASGGNDVKLLEMLGEGSFGKVYRGVWRGTDVAVKTMVLPANMSGAEKREKMAIMEAAISSSLAHPNIVQTYTYFIKAVREEANSDSGASHATDGILVGGDNSMTGAGSSSLGKTFDETPPHNSAQQAVHGYEVRLVLEFCDRGCLRDALDGDAFLAASGVNYAGVLDTAADIAKAMLHLHLADVLHGDLKARNVMLKSSGTEGRGVVGKVADFGLAVKIDAMEQTHMSGMYQGTLTHMAPELLLHGRMSKAADVYAFGVTLWELFTGGHVFQGVPRALLGHQIVQERRRPAFPPFVPEAYAGLVEECWSHRPEDRPTFEAILERLAEMRSAMPYPAAALGSYNIGGLLAPPLPKVDAAQRVPQLAVNATSNPVFDANGGLTSGGVALVPSLGANGSGSSSINWAFAKSSHRTPLAVVEEDEQEIETSSSRALPSVPAGSPQHTQPHEHPARQHPTQHLLRVVPEDAPAPRDEGADLAEATDQAGDQGSPHLPPQPLPQPAGPELPSAAVLPQDGAPQL